MSGAQIHPTAIVGAGAELAADISIDAYTIIGSRVRLGVGTIVGPHVVIEGNTTIGARNRIFQFASIGAEPQDLKYHGEDSALIIGDDNRIREFCTLQPGTEGGGMVTRVGNGNLLMNYSHIAHDCILGDRIVVANGVQLGGHVTIEDGRRPARWRASISSSASASRRSSAPGRWCRRMCLPTATPPATAPRCTGSTASV
jgi:UDP-N-acetylglucosamine acyltransferase